MGQVNILIPIMIVKLIGTTGLDWLGVREKFAPAPTHVLCTPEIGAEYGDWTIVGFRSIDSVILGGVERYGA